MGVHLVWILGDQLLAEHPALAAATDAAGRENVRVLLLSAMRHYAAALREAGYAVECVQAASFADGLAEANADDGLTATKPYIASANYINKMGDLCGGCRYNPKARTGEDACPFNFLYWNFILTHEERLRANHRTARQAANLRHLDEKERAAVRREAEAFLGQLKRET